MGDTYGAALAAWDRAREAYGVTWLAKGEAGMESAKVALDAAWRELRAERDALETWVAEHRRARDSRLHARECLCPSCEGGR